MDAGQTLRNENGFTLVELLIAITISFVAILGAYKMFSTGLRSYNLQTQVTQMHQDATYAIKKISEGLMQAGSDLPPYNCQLIFSDVDSVCFFANQGGGTYTVPATLTSVNFIALTNGAGFKGQNYLLAQSPLDSSVTQYTITTVDTNSVQDTIHLSTSGTFTVGTTIYAANKLYYYKSGTNLLYNINSGTPVVLAENIDSLNLTYYTKTHAATTTWSQYYSVLIYIRARTSVADPRYKYPGINDGYRRVPMSIEVRFRNKL